ncbi:MULTISPECIES: hypothetical protein [Actinomadura]|uniref:Uncharacterized protein n=1 Tax=Actinomadura yumaensis TaxID=111807 RepID=A0ABW2D1L0_9ACTN|nr:hypothetical protein [Actinomadura sp. J1-007]
MLETLKTVSMWVGAVVLVLMAVTTASVLVTVIRDELRDCGIRRSCSRRP